MLELFLQFVLGKFLFLALHLESGSFPRPLSPKQEQEAFARLAQGDSSARDLIIQHNLRLVVHMAKKYRCDTESLDDLVSIGTIGLIKAVSTFRPERGSRFSTYASRCIENAILSQRNKQQLRWRNGCLLRQNGTCWREWESAAIF